MSYEIKLKREQMKVDAIEESMAVNASKFSSEINMLKQMLADKQNQLKNMDIAPGDRITASGVYQGLGRGTAQGSVNGMGRAAEFGINMGGASLSGSVRGSGAGASVNFGGSKY